MKLSEQWLHEWVNPEISREKLCSILTMAGLEVDALAKVAEEFSHVVIGKVITLESHPDADRLKVCQVLVKENETPLTIVCGAPNVQKDMKVAVALPGARLAHNVKISKSKIRGVVSFGMLCSARELGIAEEGEGIISLPKDAPLGETVWHYLQLEDYVLDVAVTPNRGDCLSVNGIAREISALTQTQITPPVIQAISATHKNVTPVQVTATKECPHYVGRQLSNIREDVETPIWMQERLRRSNIRCISPVVDVMNYVMLALGQPMHAFDLEQIKQSIHVRLANKNEQITLLDNQVLTLDTDVLIIADEKNPLAIAGVMGGLDSAVTTTTKHIFIESAYFSPESVALSSRKFNLHSESSYRFERGIDPTLQITAIEYATALLLSIVGGDPGPIVEIKNDPTLPRTKSIVLRSERLQKILGIDIPANEVVSILNRLGFHVATIASGWEVEVPTRRSDIGVEVDLIEEVMRLYGYDQLTMHEAMTRMVFNEKFSRVNPLKSLRHALSQWGFHEAITYSFVDKKLQSLFDSLTPKELSNPISAEMSVMRTNLWPGLVNCLLYNHNRQQYRARFFEIGLRFIPQAATYIEQNVLSGLMAGSAFPEQWGMQTREVDFFDMRGVLEDIFQLSKSSTVKFSKGTHPALHPGQTAQIELNGEIIGICGALHPRVLQSLDYKGAIFVFEILLKPLSASVGQTFQEISKFPSLRRDIAIFVDQTVPVQAIQDTIREVGGDLLKDVMVFDVYQGKGDAPLRKSIALALTLQDNSRTLIDAEVTEMIDRIVMTLKHRFAAELRG